MISIILFATLTILGNLLLDRNSLQQYPRIISLSFAADIFVGIISFAAFLASLASYAVKRIRKMDAKRKRIAICVSILAVPLPLIALFWLGYYILQNQTRSDINASNPVPVRDTITVQGVLDETNRARYDNDLPSLAFSSLLTHAAQAKAEDLCAHNYWSHVSPNGVEPWKFIKAAGYDYWFAGENLGRDFYDAKALVNSWLASPAHKENIVGSNFKEMGIAMIDCNNRGQYTKLVVQMFGTPASESTPALNLGQIKQYLASLQSVKESWEKNSNRYPQNDLVKLIDSLNRQILFSQTLISRLEKSNGVATGDDLAMWDAVIKMSHESADFAQKVENPR